MATYDWSAAIAATEQFVVDDTAKHSDQLSANISLAQKAWAKLAPVWDACHAERVAANPKVKQTTPADFVEWAISASKLAGARWKAPVKTVAAIAVIRHHSLTARGVFTKWCAEGDRRDETIEAYRVWLPQYARGDYTPNGKDSKSKSDRVRKSQARQTTKMATTVEVDGSDITFGRVVIGQKYAFGLTTLTLLRHNLDVTIAQVAAKLSEAEAKAARDAATAKIAAAVKA